jgi:hypothetical protein
MQAEPNLEGAVAVDHRGRRYALGRTSEAYAVWALSGGPPVRTFPQEDQHWAAAWQVFQDLEAGREAETSGATAAPAPAAAPRSAARPEGVVVMDYQGSRYGVGRTRDAYAIWDLSRGGAAFETHPLSEDGWQIAWHRYQQLEGGGPSGEPAAMPAQESASGVAPEPALAEEPARKTEPAAGSDLQGAAAVDYRGGAYALGRTADGYAIWDATTGGQPILTFPANPEAWNQAWDAYQRLERAGGG